jgi:GNAT superfamily N-acetyltransferase
MNEESTAETEMRITEHLRTCLADDSHSVLVAEGAKGAVLGYVAVHWLPYLMLAGPEGYVSELFVAESARGAGLGTKLLEAVKDMAIGRGCSRLMLVNRKMRESYRRGFYTEAGVGGARGIRQLRAEFATKELVTRRSKKRHG